MSPQQGPSRAAILREAMRRGMALSPAQNAEAEALGLFRRELGEPPPAPAAPPSPQGGFGITPQAQEPPSPEREQSSPERFARNAISSFFQTGKHVAMAPVQGLRMLAEAGVSAVRDPAGAVQAMGDIARGSDAIIPGLTDTMLAPGASELIGEFVEDPVQVTADIFRGANLDEVTAERLGTATGQGAFLGVAGLAGRAIGKLPTAKRGGVGVTEIELPSGKTVQVPQLRSERTGGGASSRLESVSRRVAGGKKEFQRFEQNRTDILIDDAAVGVARDIAGRTEGGVQAGTAFQVAVERWVTKLRETAGEDISLAETAALEVVRVVDRPHLFTFMRKIQRKQLSAKRGGAPTTPSLTTANKVLKSNRAMEAEGAFEMMKILNDQARGAGLSEFPGLTAGAAKGAAAALRQDIMAALSKADPKLASGWSRANARFARAVKRFELKAVKRVLAADEEAIPGLLGKMPVRQINHLRVIAGKEKFQRAAGALIEETYLKGVQNESLLSGGLDSMGSAAKLERTFSAETVSRKFEALGQDSRLRLLVGEKGAAAIEHIGQVIRQVSKSQRSGESSLIANTIDSAVLRVTLPMTGAAVASAAFGFGPAATVTTALVAAAPVAIQLAAKLYAMAATRTTGLVLLRKAIKATGTKQYPQAIAALATFIESDEELRKIVEDGRSGVGFGR